MFYFYLFSFLIFVVPAANSFFHTACNFVAATPFLAVVAQRPPCACLHFRVAVASLWCIRCLLPAACCLGLNCKTWPFKNAPRLPKLWQCLELCWGPSSEITTTTTTKSENFVTKVKRAARCYCAEWQRGGNGSRHRSHCGCGQSYATGALKNLWKLIFLNGKLKRQLNAKRSICESGHEFYWHFHLKRVSVCVCHKVENE